MVDMQNLIANCHGRGVARWCRPRPTSQVLHSATFDVMKALKHVQEQVASSLTALSRPRQQTVSELVDSARQRIAGGDAATNAAAVGDLKLLECLGEGSVSAQRNEGQAQCWR